MSSETAIVVSTSATAAPPTRDRVKLAGFMASAGVMHFVAPGFYEKIVPRWLGHQRDIVRWSGVAEVACAALLLVPRTRRIGAWCTVVLLLAVFPANIQMAIDAGPPTNPKAIGAWLRLPGQIPMIRWALRHTA